MSSERDELIAKVYEKCGWDIGTGFWPTWVERNIPGMPYIVREVDRVGLDDFLEHIVPVLNERGWFVQLPLQQGYPKKWDGEWAASLIGPGWALRKVESTDPIEAAFAVALEVLGD